MDRQVRKSAPRVLVIERDQGFADALAVEFGQAGFTVRCTGDGEAALEEMGWEKPDVIVLDLDLPALSGRPLLALLRQYPTVRELPVLALATLSFREAQEALQAGADDCLIKPLPPDEVVAAVQDLLARMARTAAWQRSQVSPLHHTVQTPGHKAAGTSRPAGIDEAWPRAGTQEVQTHGG